MVSVIIPTYNREETIERAIKSVLEQTYENIEVLVVDDGSVDRTEEIVLNLKDNRIKFFKQNHKGAAAARNYGIEMAKGKYIAFQDSDDVWHKNKLKVQMNELEKSDYDMVFCKYMRNVRNMDGKIETYDMPGKLFNQNEISLKTILTSNYIGTPTILCKKDCFNTEKFDTSLPCLEDWDLAIRFINHYQVGYIDEVLLDAYEQNNSISRNVQNWIIASKKILKKYAHLYQQFPDLKAEHCRRLRTASEIQGKTEEFYVQRILHLESENYHLLHSTSWKITEPFRKLIRVMGKLKKKQR